MQSTASHAHTSATDSSHGHAHHEPGFFGKYIFSTDHKVIGIQYGVSSLLFLLFGFFLMLVITVVLITLFPVTLVTGLPEWLLAR
jgi:cytochrome c oxidase subunit 1